MDRTSHFRHEAKFLWKAALIAADNGLPQTASDCTFKSLSASSVALGEAFNPNSLSRDVKRVLCQHCFTPRTSTQSISKAPLVAPARQEPIVTGSWKLSGVSAVPDKRMRKIIRRSQQPGRILSKYEIALLSRFNSKRTSVKQPTSEMKIVCQHCGKTTNFQFLKQGNLPHKHQKLTGFNNAVSTEQVSLNGLKTKSRKRTKTSTLINLDNHNNDHISRIVDCPQTSGNELANVPLKVNFKSRISVDTVSVASTSANSSSFSFDYSLSTSGSPSLASKSTVDTVSTLKMSAKKKKKVSALQRLLNQQK